MKNEIKTILSNAEHLDKLMQFASPKQLRRSIQKSFNSYLLQHGDDSSDANFNQIVEDHFFLIDFLDKIEGI